MAGRLAGRVAVVTGGSTGIGQEIARKLSSEGADIAVADINPAEETRALVEANGQRFLGAKVDISDESQVTAFATEVRDTLGRADIIVNNAAVFLFNDFDNVTWQEWRKTFSVNVDGAFLVVKAFLDDLKQSAAGRVINMTSGSYWKSPPFFVSYVSAKGAVNGLTYALASSLARYDVTVNAVAPSLVRTASAVQNANPEFFDMTVLLQDLKRTQMPADVTGTVAFLASDDAAFITGQIVAVDGGASRR
jgi:NAD(P)-dependent dehydrogenase (short-subunit alcohol dehydrogenase family)